MSWEDRSIWSDKPLYDSIKYSDNYDNYRDSDSYVLGSPYRLYDYDMKTIIKRASDGRRYVTKAELIREFREYCYENDLKIKIETFLRKLRKYAESERYIRYTNKKGLYEVLI